MYRLLLIALAFLCACSNPGSDGFRAFGEVGSRDVGTLDDDAASDVSDERAWLAIDAPAAGSDALGPTVAVTGRAFAPDGIGAVFVGVEPNVPEPAQSLDGYRSWSVVLPLRPGPQEVVAELYDVHGTLVATAGPITIVADEVADGEPPGVTIDWPESGASFPRQLVLVEGRAWDDRAVVSMELHRDGTLDDERPFGTSDHFGSWSRLVTLEPGRDTVITVRAFDAGGRSADATVTIASRGVQDREPPQISIDTPAPGEAVGSAETLIAGRASDGSGVREVKLRWAVDTGSDPEWSAFQLAHSADGWATWSAALPSLPEGPVAVQARAIDLGGLSTDDEVRFVNTHEPPYDVETTYFLRLRSGEERPRATLELDRDGVNEVISEEVQRELLLLELDPSDLLVNTLVAVKDACGTGWRADDANPRHDCSRTELGRTFRGPDGTWQSSAEYSMVRLLTMTPANAQVAGTSVAGLQELADGGFFGITIGGGFSQILADSLGIGRTDEFLSTETTAQALLDNVVATHPHTGPAGELPITLWDVMNDLAPMAELLGPAGDHPGIVDPASPPSGAVFTDEFAMVLTADSNLVWHDGIDLSDGKDYLALVVDETGPTFDDVVEFDFEDPDLFELRGLAAAPTADMRFLILEDDRFVDSCNGTTDCQSNLPDAPRGSDSLWALPRWTTEYIVTDAGLAQYGDRVHRQCYIDFLGCHAEVNIGQDGAPSGWANFDIILDLGDPPGDQYLWELITEVAQVALHRLPDRTIPEGDADVAFSVTDIPVGLTANEIREAVRPTLQSQAATLADMLLGDFETNNGRVDLYLAANDRGEVELRFISEADPRPTDDYDYTRPGFFSAEDLSEESRVSTNVDGAEVLALTPGESLLWVRDDQDRDYRVRVAIDPDRADEIVVHVAERRR